MSTDERITRLIERGHTDAETIARLMVTRDEENYIGSAEGSFKGYAERARILLDQDEAQA